MIKVGTTLRHIKRGSHYLVVASAHTVGEFGDQDNAYLQLDGWKGLVITKKPLSEYTSLALPVAVQVSLEFAAPDATPMWVYRGEHGMYARPKDEFTPDRFEELA